MENNNTNDAAANKPLHVVEIDNVRAAIFKARSNGQGNGAGHGLRIAFGRRYKDNDGRWKTSYMFNPDEIGKAVRVLAQVDEYVTSSNGDPTSGVSPISL